MIKGLGYGLIQTTGHLILSGNILGYGASLDTYTRVSFPINIAYSFSGVHATFRFHRYHVPLLALAFSYYWPSL